MGLKSQFCSKKIAKDLERVLKKGIEIKDKKIINFLKEHIYPIYKRHSSEANYPGDKRVRKHYSKG